MSIFLFLHFFRLLVNVHLIYLIFFTSPIYTTHFLNLYHYILLMYFLKSLFNSNYSCCFLLNFPIVIINLFKINLVDQIFTNLLFLILINLSFLINLYCFQINFQNLIIIFTYLILIFFIILMHKTYHLLFILILIFLFLILLLIIKYDLIKPIVIINNLKGFFYFYLMHFHSINFLFSNYQFYLYLLLFLYPILQVYYPNFTKNVLIEVN